MEYYEIVVMSHIGQKRLKYFRGLAYRHLPNRRTLIFGTLKDQAELFSILNRIRDMNLTLLSINNNQSILEHRPAQEDSAEQQEETGTVHTKKQEEKQSC